ncbi:MAG TPA: hypothetical protein VK308_14620 [Pyrinomonadaceae bacterium]|nr:hypothetical protein [Pyrinomonadaceae bacterium]
MTFSTRTKTLEAMPEKVNGDCKLIAGLANFKAENRLNVLDKPESVSLTNVPADLRGFNDIVKMYAE